MKYLSHPSHRMLLRAVITISILSIMALGLFLRVKDYREWKKHPEQAFFQGHPLLTTFDACYYLRFARELLDGEYTGVDALRAVPQQPPRPMPAPLLSVVAMATARITGISLDWVAVFLPPLLGILLFIPLFFIGRLWCNSVAGLTAGLVGLASPVYVNRSILGRFDTDCANVTFLMTAVFLAILLSRSHGWRKAWVLGGAVLNAGLFAWWWDSVPYVAIATSLLPLALGYLATTRPLGRALLVVLTTTAVFCAVLILWKGREYCLQLFSEAFQLHRYIAKEDFGDFPNVGVTVSEQVRMSLQDLFASTGGEFLFVLAAAGLALLIYQVPARAAFLAVPLGLGLLATFYAQRFAIFLTPLAALGTGHFYGILCERFRLSPWKSWRFAVFAMGLAAAPFLLGQLLLASLTESHRPVESSLMVQSMAAAREMTPPGSVIWAWWDHGYALMYYTRRGAISDGTYHAGELSMVNAFPLCTSDYGLAARWMKFYVVQGPKGFDRVYRAMGGVANGMEWLKDILAAGPEAAPALLKSKELRPVEEWVDFLFPKGEKVPPIYLLLDSRLASTNYWWYWLGTWDPRKKDGIHPYFQTFVNVEQHGSRVSGFPDFDIDLKKGVLLRSSETIPLSQFVFHDGQDWKSRDFPAEGLIFEFDEPNRRGALCSPGIFNSVFNRLFFLKMADVRFFKPVLLKSDHVQIWKVE